MEAKYNDILKTDDKLLSKIESITRNEELISFANSNNIPSHILPCLLSVCPVGKGEIYEKFVLRTIIEFMGVLIDHELVARHRHENDGFMDIEFPFCSEMLSDYPQWKAWYHEYKIKFLTIEVKNLKEAADRDAALQIKSYIEDSGRGNFGFLVSHNGFTKPCLGRLNSYARNGILILPLDNNDLMNLITAASDSSLKKVIQYLRRKEQQLFRHKVKSRLLTFNLF